MNWFDAALYSGQIPVGKSKELYNDEKGYETGLPQITSINSFMCSLPKQFDTGLYYIRVVMSVDGSKFYQFSDITYSTISDDSKTPYPSVSVLDEQYYVKVSLGRNHIEFYLFRFDRGSIDISNIKIQNLWIKKIM